MPHESTRVHYQEELERLEQQALGGLDLVVQTLDRTIEAAEHQDVELAELVIADDDRIDGRYLEVHQAILTLLATQAPVATDLRLISALLHVMNNMERMGPVREHREGHPDRRPRATRRRGDGARHRHDGQAGASLITQAKRAFADRDVDLARDLVRQDDVIDNLNREVFNLALQVGDNEDRREWAMTMMLVARALERVGDNAVDIGEQVAFVVTGLFREFEDASHPGAVAPQPVAARAGADAGYATRAMASERP